MNRNENTKNMETRKEEQQDKTLQDFTIEAKRNIVDIINDCPSIVKVGDKEYRIKNMRYYSLTRISKLCLAMKEADKSIDNDNKIITALCTDLDAMCEIVAVVLCNHYFTPDEISDFDDVDRIMTRNDKMVALMKAKVMNSTYDQNQWAAIILSAIKSVDLGGFFLLRESVNTLTNSLLMRKKKSMEIASQFMEAQSLQTQQTS